MKLSEAIRLGAMLKPQAFGEYFKDGGSCALGAAKDACGAADSDETIWSLAYEMGWPLDKAMAMPCPHCGRSLTENTIPHLNDFHMWTREQIADWVESIENAQQVETPAAAEVVTA